MSVLVALIKGTQNSDYHLSRLLKAITTQGVGEGLEVTTNQVAKGYAFVETTRAGGESFYVEVEVTADTVIDTTGTKKVRLELAQSFVDDYTTVPADRDGVATIETGASYPGSGNFVKLASITSGTITDEREYISARRFMNITGDQDINGVKTFKDDIEVEGDTTFTNLPTKTGSGVALQAVADGELLTKYHLDNTVIPIPDLDETTKGIGEQTTDAEYDAGTDTTRIPKASQTRIKAVVLSGTVTYNDIAQSDMVLAHGLGAIPRVAIGETEGNYSGGNTYGGFAGDVDGSSRTQKVYNADSDNYSLPGIFGFGPNSSSDRGRRQVASADDTNITLSWTHTAGSYSLTTVDYMLLLIA
jgi:hypothetical protein